MKKECIQKEIGKQLHAYELSALNEEMKAEFELHILKCESCFKELQGFEKEAAILKQEIFTEGLEKVSSKKVKPLWENFTISSAVLATLVVMLIYPAFLGLTTTPDSSVSTVESIVLVPVRSADNRYSLNQENDIVISFVYPDVDKNKSYIVEIFNNDQKVITLDDYKDFDRYNTGRILISKGILTPGNFQLRIIENSESSNNVIQEFNFQIL